MSQVVIHIGANKTGSTTLQRCLFARSQNLVYLGEDGAEYSRYRATLDSLVSDDAIHFCHDAAYEMFQTYLQRSGEHTFLYSNEDIMTSRVPTQCAYRLHEFLPEAEILMVTRNQLTAVPSWYANHGAYLRMVPRRYWRRYVSFDDWMEYCTTFLKYSPLDGYFYHRIAALYGSLFGKHKIHVLMYEDFVNEPEQFIRGLCEILRIDAFTAMEMLQGQRERKRHTQRQLRYHRFRSWFFWGHDFSRYIPFGKALDRKWQHFLEQGAPADGFMSDFWRNKLIELYKEDNLQLAREYQLPLKEYGYPIANR